jgi:asparagine synthase (glutamine-hydrolysing)
VVHLKETITKAIKDCIHPGERVAVQLSGGLDSAIIQAVAKLPDLYCVTWPEQDNITMAKLAARGHEVRTVTFTREEMLEVLPEVAHLTNGEGTWSQVCQWFACKQIAADGCTAVLTGEGADELFGGYTRYRILYWLDRMAADPLLADYRGIITHTIGTREEVLNRMLARTSTNKAGINLSGGMVEAMATLDTLFGLPPLLEYGEAMAAAHGLQCRFPFMAQGVIDAAAQLPQGVRVIERESKVPLRQVARELGVARPIVNEKTKKGLFIPQDWRPEGEPQWSRGWFEKLMREAYGTA